MKGSVVEHFTVNSSNDTICTYCKRVLKKAYPSNKDRHLRSCIVYSIRKNESGKSNECIEIMNNCENIELLQEVIVENLSKTVQKIPEGWDIDLRNKTILETIVAKHKYTKKMNLIDSLKEKDYFILHDFLDGFDDEQKRALSDFCLNSLPPPYLAKMMSRYLMLKEGGWSSRKEV